MGALLRALEVRLRDGEGQPDGDDGYYVRLKRNNKKLGPMTEYQFNALRSSKEDVSEVASAWRVSGGQYYKVQMQHGIIWDTAHACSPKAWNHACEMIVIAVCFCCTIGVFLMLRQSPEFRKEREKAGEGMWYFLLVLMFLTVVTGAMTMHKLVTRWRKASTEVFVSEV